MSFKFKDNIEEYMRYLTPEMIKKDFEEYGFTMEYKDDDLKALESDWKAIGNDIRKVMYGNKYE